MRSILLSIAILLTIQMQAQILHQGDFSWAPLDSVFTAMTTTTICEGDSIQITLSSTSAFQRNLNLQGNPLSNGHPTTSVLLPYPTITNALTATVTLTFSPPIADLQVLLRDLDDDAAPFGPEETFSNFLVNGLPMMPTSVVPTTGSFSVVGNTVNPLTANCNGWYKFATGNIGMLTFDYSRDTNRYAFLLDSLQFTCNSNFVGLVPAATDGFLEVSPIPAEGFLDLKMTLGNHKPWSIFVFDPAGRLVMTQEMTQDQARIAVGDLENGMYFLKVEAGQRTCMRKILVAH